MPDDRITDPCSILRLPNEILLEILEFFATSYRIEIAEPVDVFDQYYRKVYGSTEPNTLRFRHRVLLRCVCKRFRNLVDNMQVSYNCDSKLSKDFKAGEELNWLVKDDDDVGRQEILVRWRLRRCIRDLVDLEKDPKTSIPDDAITLRLYAHERSAHSNPIRSIPLSSITRRYENIKYLGIHHPFRNVNLDILPAMFPQLSALFLSVVDFCGTLESMPRLQYLAVDLVGWGDYFHRDFLPIMSENTLTHLCLNFYLFRPGESVSMRGLLLDFHALRHLHLEPLMSYYIDFLHATELRLVTFETKLGWPKDDVDVPLLAHLFNARSLQTIENLSLKLLYWDADIVELYPEFSEDQAPVITAITSNCRHLRTIVFEMPIDINWTTDFKSLRSLEYVEWTILSSFIYRQESKIILTEAFQKACNRAMFWFFGDDNWY